MTYSYGYFASWSVWTTRFYEQPPRGENTNNNSNPQEGKVKVERAELLRKLEAVAPGLATREAVEQSSCFVFTGGRVVTFNDEIACGIDCDLGFTGAVAAKPLLDLLGKLSEAELDITCTGEEVVVRGKRRRAGIVMEAQITLPIGSVEQPTEWVDMDADFADAIGVVEHCASKDTNNFHLTCVHVTPTCVEACDNFQLARYPLNTGVREPCLVKRDSIKHVTGLGMTEVSETKTWLHFRNQAGLVLSVRREVGEFENLDEIINSGGERCTLPGGLAEAVDKAEIFSADNGTDNVVTVELRANKLSLRGMGATGWYEERKEVKWEQEPMAFNINPKLLVGITTKTNDCFIATGRLTIDGGKFKYVTCLGTV